jgi:hypothetical protein
MTIMTKQQCQHAVTRRYSSATLPLYSKNPMGARTPISFSGQWPRATTKTMFSEIAGQEEQSAEAAATSARVKDRNQHGM